VQVVALVNSKGGCGKSALARALSLLAATPDDGAALRVALVDLDPQQTVAAWWSRRGAASGVCGEMRNPDLFGETNVSAAEAIERLRESGLYDLAVVDTPPAFLEELAEVLASATVALIPLLPDIDNITATRDAIVLARRAGVPFRVVINRAPSARQADMAREILARALGAEHIAQAAIRDRVAYSQAHDVGKAAHEMKSAASREAAKDLQLIWSEVRDLLADVARQDAKGRAHA